MRFSHRSFVVSGAAAVAFGITLMFITPILSEMEILEAKAKEMNNLTSARNVGMYFRSALDGLTWGAFAKEGIFTEANKYEREWENLRAQYIRLKTRYEMGLNVGRCFLAVGLVALAIGLISRRKEAGRASTAPSELVATFRPHPNRNHKEHKMRGAPFSLPKLPPPT